MIEAERGTWVLVEGRWIPKSQYARQYKQAVEAQRMRSDLASPMVMRDIEPFRNVAIDGAEISSRSAKREMMKRHGLVEMGNSFSPPKKRAKRARTPVRETIKRSLQELG